MNALYGLVVSAETADGRTLMLKLSPDPAGALQATAAHQLSCASPLRRIVAAKAHGLLDNGLDICRVRPVAQSGQNVGEVVAAPERWLSAPHQVGDQFGEFGGPAIKSILF
jgi:hypothetical protein